MTTIETTVPSQSDPVRNSTRSVADALNGLLADAFALYVKTKNFHWHVSGPYFRDYHLLFDQQAAEILGVTDDIAERVRKIGDTTLRSVGDIARRQTITDNEQAFVSPADMVAELYEDNLKLLARLRAARLAAEAIGDTATSSMADDWIDQAEKRAWFLLETRRTS